MSQVPENIEYAANGDELPFLLIGRSTNISTLGVTVGGTDTMEFRPEYIPNRIKLSKERKLSRNSGFCGLEDVHESHGKNREVHLSGYILRSELESFSKVLDWNKEAELVTPGLPEGLIVRVNQGDREGPVAYDPQYNEYQWRYSLDLLSTGDSERRAQSTEDGIISEGDEQ